MRIAFFFFLCTILGASLGLADETARDKKDKSAKSPNVKLKASLVRKLKKEIEPALKAGEYGWAANQLAPIIAKSEPELIARVDQYLQSKALPAATKIYSENAIRMIQQTLVDPNKVQLTQREIAILIPAISKRIEEFVETSQKSDVLNGTEPLPKKWNEVEEFFWLFHVRRNEIQSYTELANFGAALSANLTKQNVKDDIDSELLKQANQLMAYPEKLQSIVQANIEREALYRFGQVQTASTGVVEATTFRERFTQMNSVKSASLFFDEFFEDYSPERFASEKLRDKEIENEVKLAINDATQGRSDLVEKVELFQKGLHWWLRGRYGEGSEFNGLLKSHHALKSNKAMFGLFMPKTRPIPKDPLAEKGETETYPRYQRRHFHNWEIGHQEFKESLRSNGRTGRISGKVTTTLGKFY